ncbi:CUE domain-containing protein C354.10-like isoform X2 [Salvia hispanica]|uniref:CUE domain-containing protein C354.10-like isoform X2 n=1 Tax=Salvia hispanica TaxID=49212 RepID=UPI0020094E74|nr:CUE domain-containing protein C354.10-like isoform X2 [Salvia hispanica]
MVDKSKKSTISEDDMSAVLQRYSLNTVLALLQEVDQAAAGVKINWREVVKNSATGISGAREYQMLWRHLTYGEPLIDHLDNDAEPLDDDSDLEHEVEPLPAVGREASVEAAACVNVLIASGYPNNPQPPNNSTIEAPLTINIPNTKAVCASSDDSHLSDIIRGTKNVTISVSVPKQPLSSGVSGEKRLNDEVTEVNPPSRKRRRSWTLEEDTKLTASVQNHGERNWENIARGDFKNDRTASELSHRWYILRKKQGNTKGSTSSQPPETQLAAAHRAMNLALDRPMSDNLKSVSHKAAAGIKVQHQPPKASASPADQPFPRVGPSKPQMLASRPSVNPISDTDSMIKAAAVAAGARIATPTDASSLIEAARSQNVVHITTGSIGHQLPSNVHFIRNGLAKAPISTYSAPKPNILETGEAKPAQSRSTKPAASAALSPTGAVPVLNAISVKESAAVPALPNPSAKLPVTAVDVVVSTLGNEKKELGKSNQLADQAGVSGCLPVEQEHENRPVASGNQSEEVGNSQPSSSGNALQENTGGDKASDSVSEPVSRATSDGIALPSLEVEQGKTNIDGQLTSEGTAEDTSIIETSEDLPSTSKNGAAI